MLISTKKASEIYPYLSFAPVACQETLLVMEEMEKKSNLFCKAAGYPYWTRLFVR